MGRPRVMFDPNCSPRGLRRFRPPRNTVGQRWSLRRHRRGLTDPLGVSHQPVVAPSPTNRRFHETQNYWTPFVLIFVELRHRFGRRRAHRGFFTPRRLHGCHLWPRKSPYWWSVLETANDRRHYATSDETQGTTRCAVAWGTNPRINRPKNITGSNELQKKVHCFHV